MRLNHFVVVSAIDQLVDVISFCVANKASKNWVLGEDETNTLCRQYGFCDVSIKEFQVTGLVKKVFFFV